MKLPLLVAVSGKRGIKWGAGEEKQLSDAIIKQDFPNVARGIPE
jgi:hypothetical protein